MASCLIECTFDGKWVLQESKKNVLPVEVLVSDLLTGFGDEKSVTVLKKNYTGCRLVVSLPGDDPHNLEQEIHRILRQHWADDEAEKACTCSLQPLSPEEADRLLGAEKQEAARKTEKKGKRAAASDIPVEKEERAEKAMDGENLPARRTHSCTLNSSRQSSPTPRFRFGRYNIAHKAFKSRSSLPIM